jgi:excisionase family DNA binding protein
MTYLHGQKLYHSYFRNATLDAKDVAAIIKVAVKTVHKLARDGKLACVQITRRERRFTQEQVQQYIDSRSTHVIVDKKDFRPVSSYPRKGGDRAKSSGVFSRQALLEEMRKCR